MQFDDSGGRAGKTGDGTPCTFHCKYQQVTREVNIIRSVPPGGAENKTYADCSLMPKNPFNPNDIIIRFYQASKRFGDTDALVEVTFDVPRNDFLFITGPSGAGKSTLIKLLYLAERLSGGNAIIDGMNLARVGRRQIPILRRKMGVIFQDFKLIATQTVFDNVALVLKVAGIRSRKTIRKRVMEVLDTVGMADRLNALPPTLSGGEKQRVAVARAMIGRPDIILADEPTASLDPEASQLIVNLLLDAHGDGATVIITTHDRDLLSMAGANILFLENGRCVDRTSHPGEICP